MAEISYVNKHRNSCWSSSDYRMPLYESTNLHCSPIFEYQNNSLTFFHVKVSNVPKNLNAWNV